MVSPFVDSSDAISHPPTMRAWANGRLGYVPKVYTFGNGDHGKLGHGDLRKVSVPTLVAGLVNMHVIKVASSSSVCGWREEGRRDG